MMPGGMILFVTLEGCWNMDLTNIEFIDDAAINRRRYWGLRANGTKTYAKEITNCYN